ncbi:hypothetical protein PRIPAC_73426 [Pristionchus pacificus]|uniref:Uncharacterized protein n=1 Tax=Pristionchus pacificus TaxID=54126 RepID=A0A2A6CSR4_PRIPA|nr:hypothetical protein PRIPAC_73426 [Pristionchus pacificus]|eukprot:PDM81081.1 hypothetical protein PRIPAC_36084 [Pristionchus pacificus]
MITSILLLSLLSFSAFSSPILNAKKHFNLPDDFCSQCVLSVEDFLSNINIENTFFTQICSNMMHSDSDKNPMVKVCVAGFLGEMEYVRERLQGHSDEEICDWLGCPQIATTTTVLQ